MTLLLAGYLIRVVTGHTRPAPHTLAHHKGFKHHQYHGWYGGWGLIVVVVMGETVVVVVMGGLVVVVVGATVVVVVG